MACSSPSIVGNLARGRVDSGKYAWHAVGRKPLTIDGLNDTLYMVREMRSYLPLDHSQYTVN
jgi:hypothetical protein